MELRAFVVMCFISAITFGQRELYVRPGLINASATITPTLMLNRPESNYYISGHLEGMVDEHLSFRGETFYFIDSDKDTSFFKTSMRTYFGVLYHLNKGNFDSHIGFMPGIALMQVNPKIDPLSGNTVQAVPTFAINLGITYYIWKFFNFYANVTYANSTIRDIRGTSGRADEIMISAGLGFNINTVKAK